ncbi:MAG: Prolyl-tRNA editing protein ProX [Parcubacteria group bacterium ADurb.Bin326]|nr:MAG: Prolyl-tRNA editing protein ProX [Parcubacteria group bacterium ADurb.Bin326]
MPIPAKVKKYLDSKGVDYEELAHKTVYTAYDAAQTLKKQLKEIAKTILVEADKTHALVVLPADKKIDMEKLKKALGAKKISIPNEKVMIKVLKIKPGTLSSFGRLHDLEVVVDKAMLGVKKAVVSTGSFTDSVFIKVKDFVQSEEARLANVAMSGGYKIPKKMKKQMKKVKSAVAKKKAAKKPTKKASKPAKKAVKKVAKKAVKKTAKPATKKVVKKTVKKVVKKK